MLRCTRHSFEFRTTATQETIERQRVKTAMRSPSNIDLGLFAAFSGGLVIVVLKQARK